jgi:hypothetical protein
VDVVLESGVSFNISIKNRSCRLKLTRDTVVTGYTPKPSINNTNN